MEIQPIQRIWVAGVGKPTSKLNLAGGLEAVKLLLGLLKRLKNLVYYVNGLNCRVILFLVFMTNRRTLLSVHA